MITWESLLSMLDAKGIVPAVVAVTFGTFLYDWLKRKPKLLWWLSSHRSNEGASKPQYFSRLCILNRGRETAKTVDVEIKCAVQILASNRKKRALLLSFVGKENLTTTTALECTKFTISNLRPNQYIELELTSAVGVSEDGVVVVTAIGSVENAPAQFTYLGVKDLVFNVQLWYQFFSWALVFVVLVWLAQQILRFLGVK